MANRGSHASQAIDRAAHGKRASIEHVRIDHRRTDVGVPEQLLHRTDAVTVFEQVRRERMAQCVRTDPLRDADLPCRVGDGALDDGLVKVKARRRSPSRIGTDA